MGADPNGRRNLRASGGSEAKIISSYALTNNFLHRLPPDIVLRAFGHPVRRCFSWTSGKNRNNKKTATKISNVFVWNNLFGNEIQPSVECAKVRLFPVPAMVDKFDGFFVDSLISPYLAWGIYGLFDPFTTTKMIRTRLSIVTLTPYDFPKWYIHISIYLFIYLLLL